MKNSRLRNILSESTVVGDTAGRKFAMALYKNIKKIESYLDDVAKLIEPSSAYAKVQKQINRIYESYADLDQDKKPLMESEVMPDGRRIERYIITNPDRQDKVDAEMEKLRNSNQKLFLAHEKKLTRYNDELNDECTIKFKMVPEDDVPESITPRQTFLFEFMIKFDK